MKTLCKLTSINKKTNAFKTVSKSCIMEGSETTEVSIPVKPVTEVIITHKNHWNRGKRLVEEFMNSAMFISTNSNLMSIEEWHDAKADVTSSLIYWIYFNKTLNCYVEGCLKNLIHLAVYQYHLKMITVNSHYRKYVKLTFHAQYSRPLRRFNIGDSVEIKNTCWSHRDAFFILFTCEFCLRYRHILRKQRESDPAKRTRTLPSKDLMCFFWAALNAVLNSSLALTSAPASINNSTDLQIQNKNKENFRI